MILQYQRINGEYTFVYEYDPVKFDISQITGDYWISGNYIFPRDDAAADSLKTLAKADEDRRKQDRRMHLKR